jgi:chemotaxis protein methyltransferase CheR
MEKYKSWSDVAIHAVSSIELTQVTDGELSQFAGLIYARTGIRISPQKKTLLSNRLRRRLRDNGIKNFSDYYKHLQLLRNDDPEWEAFLQEITTHETYLFRDENQWKWFLKEFIPSLSNSGALQSPNRVRIWSAACSTGDEPYTAACCLAACHTNLSRLKIEIVATDIGVGALEQARSGLFNERAMRLVPEEYRRQFFTKAKQAGFWQAKPILTSMIHFKSHNLLEPIRERSFDLAIVKNVLIYFDAASKRRVMENVIAAIAPGGLLLSGAAEGITEYVKEFKRFQPWLFRKPPVR